MHDVRCVHLEYALQPAWQQIHVQQLILFCTIRRLTLLAVLQAVRKQKALVTAEAVCPQSKPSA